MNYHLNSTSFLGRGIDTSESYVVVGSGISGLLMGYYLKKANISFKIVEKSDQPGGILRTMKTPYGITETAANGFIWCPEIQSICDDLGLDILPPSQASKARYILKNGKLRKIPFSVLDGFRFAAALLRKHPEPFETIEDFGNYFFGKGITKRVIAPALAGIYGANLDQLSFPGTMGKLADGFNESQYLKGAFQKMRSGGTNEEKKKRKAGTHSFENGMQQWITRLAEHLKDDIEYGVDGTSLSGTNERLIITTPAYVAKDFFEGRIAQLLGQVRYNTMISTTIFVKKSSIPKFKPGFGCLIPSGEGFKIIGVLFNSCIFENRVVEDDLLSLTCLMRDDSINKELLSMSDNQIAQLVKADLNRLFGSGVNTVESVVTRWKKGFPVYSPTLYKSWSELDKILKEEFPNRNLFCNYTGDISIRAMTQAIHKLL